MISSVRQLVDSIREIAVDDLAGLFQTVYYGSEFKEYRTKDYPMCWYFVQGNGSFENNYVSIPVTFRLLDVVGSLNNLDEKDINVKTAMVRASDLLVQRMRAVGLFYGDITQTLEIVYYQDTHGMSGVEFTINCIIQKACLVSLDIPQPPIATDVRLETAALSIEIDLADYFSDPDGLFVQLQSVGIPTYGTISLDGGNIITWAKVNEFDDEEGIATYTVINSAGLTATAYIYVTFVGEGDFGLDYELDFLLN